MLCGDKYDLYKNNKYYRYFIKFQRAGAQGHILSHFYAENEIYLEHYILDDKKIDIIESEYQES